MRNNNLPDDIYRFVDGEQDIINEQETVSPVDKAELTDHGLRVYLKGAHYPQKGMADPATLFAINLAKRHFIEPVKFFNKWYFYPGLLISAFNLERILQAYNDMTWRFIKPYIFKPQYMDKMPRELDKWMYSFLVEIGVKDYVAEQFSASIASTIEFDSAYKMRVLDIFSETDKERMKKPTKELKRLMKLMMKRSNTLTTKKFVALSTIISVILLIPKYKRAYLKTLESVDWNNMVADEIDRYWMSLRKEGYDYLGLSDDERRDNLEKEGKSLPVLIPRK